jgi:CHAT domain-containing protein
MKARRKWIVLGVIMAAALAVGFAAAWVFWGPFSFESAEAKVKEEAVLLNGHDPQRMLAEANRFYWGHNLPLALPLYQRAESLFTQAHDARDALYAKIGVMRSGDETSFPDLSAFIATQLRNPLVQDDPFLRLWCLGVKGDADEELNVNAAERDWDQVESLANKLGQKEWANRARGELGLVAYLRGDYRTAVARIGKALLTAIWERDDGTEVRHLELVGNGLNGLNRQAEAMEFFDRAIRIASHDGYIGTPFMAYEGRAEAFEGMGETARAQSLMERTLAEARREKMWEHLGQDLVILGEFASSAGHSNQARNYLEQAIDSAKRMGMCRVVAESYFDLADLSEKAGDLTQAASETQQGARYMSEAGDTIYLTRSLNALAALKAQTGHVRQAHQLYQQAEAVIDEMLARAPGSYTESSLLSAMSDTYLADFALAADDDKPTLAFSVIQRARGRTVSDMLRDHRADPPATKQQAALESKVAAEESEMLGTTDRQQQNAMLAALEQEEETLGYFQTISDPVRRQMTARPADLDAVQQTLLPDEAVLEYVLGESSSFCLAFDQKNSEIVKLRAGKEQLEGIVSDYLKRIDQGRFARRDAQQLYSLLMEPIPASLRPERLVIVPDDYLNQLPFEALQSEPGKYVIESHVVSYAPSATVLSYLRNRRAIHEPQMAYLGVGDVPYGCQAKTTTIAGMFQFFARGAYDMSGGRLGDLPNSRLELTESEQALGQPQASVLLTGKDARVKTFESEPLSNFKIIHFAVHGYSAPDFPERSGLILARDAGSKTNGILQVRDVAGLPLDADLVTLSSCDTGTGKAEGEEGITGLVPAFLFAGARSVVGSLWPADDSATETEMTHLYSHLAHGEDPAAALRDAKLDYIRLEGSRPPIFWAGFILVGDGSRPIKM